jgi:hypothetical protein
VRRIIRNKLVQSTLVAWVLFWLVAYVLPTTYTFDVTNSFSISVGIGALFIFWRGFWASITAEVIQPRHFLVFGLWNSIFWTISRHGWNWFWRYMGKPAWMIDHDFVAFQIAALSIAWCYVMISKPPIDVEDMLPGQIPVRNWQTLGFYVTLALFIAGLFIAFLEPSPYVDLQPLPQLPTEFGGPYDYR